MPTIRPSILRSAVRSVLVAVALFTAVVSLAQARDATVGADESESPAAHGAIGALSDPAASIALALLDPGSPHPSGPRLSFDGKVEPVTGLRPQVLQGGVSTSLLDVSNRVWLGYGRAAFGVGVGLQTARIDQPIGSNDVNAFQATRPSLSVGWRYRFTPTSQFYAGASAARAWGNDDDLPRYNARAGVEWKVAKSRIGFDGGRLGVQLDSGYRMSIRTRSGGVQLALRRTF